MLCRHVLREFDVALGKPHLKLADRAHSKLRRRLLPILRLTALGCLLLTKLPNVLCALRHRFLSFLKLELEHSKRMNKQARETTTKTSL